MKTAQIKMIALAAAAVGLSFGAAFADDVKTYSCAKAKLVPCGDAPCVQVNGELLPPQSFTAFMPHRIHDDYLRDIDKAGIRIHYIYSWTRVRQGRRHDHGRPQARRNAHVATVKRDPSRENGNLI